MNHLIPKLYFSSVFVFTLRQVKIHASYVFDRFTVIIIVLHPWIFLNDKSPK